MMMMMMIRRRAPVVLNHEPVQVRHREKLGISTREIDSRNPQARSPSFTTRIHICHYHNWKGVGSLHLSQNLFLVYTQKMVFLKMK